MGKFSEELAHHAAHEVMKGAGCIVTSLVMLTGVGTFSAVVAWVLLA
ncbi:MAG: hypothetical protein IKH58_04080 [Bacteroidales bacterium]|nr:hypothetical protein [Bacteroidales bacterium]